MTRTPHLRSDAATLASLPEARLPERLLNVTLELLDALDHYRASLLTAVEQGFTALLDEPGAVARVADLVGEVVHDLRSPLNSILFGSEGASGPLNEYQHSQLGLIYSATLAMRWRLPPPPPPDATAGG